MVVSNDMALQIEAKLLSRLQLALLAVCGSDFPQVAAKGLLATTQSDRVRKALEIKGFKIVGEIYDGMNRRYIDGQIIGDLAFPFRRFFATEQIHFHLLLNSENSNSGIDFSKADTLHLPALYHLEEEDLEALLPFL